MRYFYTDRAIVPYLSDATPHPCMVRSCGHIRPTAFFLLGTPGARQAGLWVCHAHLDESYAALAAMARLSGDELSEVVSASL